MKTTLKYIIENVQKRVNYLSKVPNIDKNIEELKEQIQKLEAEKRSLDYNYSESLKALSFWGDEKLINRKINFIKTHKDAKVKNFVTGKYGDKENEIQLLNEFLAHTTENKKPCHEYNSIIY